MSWQFMPHAPEMRSAQAAMLKSAKAPTVPKVPSPYPYPLPLPRPLPLPLPLPLLLPLSLT